MGFIQELKDIARYIRRQVIMTEDEMRQTYKDMYEKDKQDSDFRPLRGAPKTDCERGIHGGAEQIEVYGGTINVCSRCGAPLD